MNATPIKFANAIQAGLAASFEPALAQAKTRELLDLFQEFAAHLEFEANGDNDRRRRMQKKSYAALLDEIATFLEAKLT
jgi:hypothetical protein